LSDSKVGIVTYGGNGNWSVPSITAVRGLSTSTHRQNILNAIQIINFDGPDYTPGSTVDALNFVSQTIKTAPSRIAKCILVIAHETEEKVCYK